MLLFNKTLKKISLSSSTTATWFNTFLHFMRCHPLSLSLNWNFKVDKKKNNCQVPRAPPLIPDDKKIGNRRSIPPLDNRICTNYEKPAGMFLLSLVTLITLNFSPILFVETK